MRSFRRLFIVLPLLAVSVACARGGYSQTMQQTPIVRLAELEIDPAQLESYKAALREEIEASIRIEPGVLTLYAVAIKDHPEKISLFETYRDLAAYRSHLQTPHFKKYKQQTAGMVRSLTLLETEPILLGSNLK